MNCDIIDEFKGLKITIVPIPFYCYYNNVVYLSNITDCPIRKLFNMNRNN